MDGKKNTPWSGKYKGSLLKDVVSEKIYLQQLKCIFGNESIIKKKISVFSLRPMHDGSETYYDDRGVLYHGWHSREKSGNFVTKKLKYEVNTFV